LSSRIDLCSARKTRDPDPQTEEFGPDQYEVGTSYGSEKVSGKKYRFNTIGYLYVPAQNHGSC